MSTSNLSLQSRQVEHSKHPFSIVYQTKYGSTVYSDDPRTDAMKYQGLLLLQGRKYSTVEHADGTVTVLGDGLMSLTFEGGN